MPKPDNHKQIKTKAQAMLIDLKFQRNPLSIGSWQQTEKCGLIKTVGELSHLVGPTSFFV